MHGARSASLTLDLIIVVMAFVLAVFAAAYRPASEADPASRAPDPVVVEPVEEPPGGEAIVDDR